MAYINKRQAEGIAALSLRMKVKSKAYAKAYAGNGNEWNEEAHTMWDIAQSAHNAIEWALGVQNDDVLRYVAQDEKDTLRFYGFDVPRNIHIGL